MIVISTKSELAKFAGPNEATIVYGGIRIAGCGNYNP
jgi:hypothetical protein